MVKEKNKLEIIAKKYRGETTTVTTRLPVDLVQKLEEIVEKTGRTRNELIQNCLEYAIDNIEITQD